MCTISINILVRNTNERLEFSFDQEFITVGTSKSADLRLKDPSISN